MPIGPLFWTVWRILLIDSLAAGKSRIEGTLEHCGRSGTLDHDQIIVLALEAGPGKVSGASAQQPPVDLVGLEVHWRGGIVAGQDLGGNRCDDLQLSISSRRSYLNGTFAALAEFKVSGAMGVVQPEE